ncbi:MAG: 4-hydroxy-tetrahydrodipicolinate reductase [Clostridia bacterium]|nr:4-hydroxy-tetrahydrodipicolinate reductase [Clostridia bacterium]
MINVLINGFNGKMGQEIFKQINESNEFKVCCGVDRSNNKDYNFPIYNDYNSICVTPDVIIDFSVPDASINILKFAKNHNIPIVIATTGFSDEQLKIIKDYSKLIPIFRSGNMSYEVNIMADLVAKLAQQLKESDIEIIETHHRNKIDSPSGTALILADSINEALNNKMIYKYNRHEEKIARSKKEIGIHSVRGGTEVGKHTVMFLGENESFEITHTVTSRSIFAKGALKAAKFLIKQNAGLYNMKDLID